MSCLASFNGIIPSSATTIHKAYSVMEEFWTANPVAHSRVSQGTVALSTWIFPSISVLKINCDASWTKQSGSTGFGVVIKDTSGSVMARNCGTSSSAL